MDLFAAIYNQVFLKANSNPGTAAGGTVWKDLTSAANCSSFVQPSSPCDDNHKDHQHQKQTSDVRGGRGLSRVTSRSVVGGGGDGAGAGAEGGVCTENS